MCKFILRGLFTSLFCFWGMSFVNAQIPYAVYKPIGTQPKEKTQKQQFPIVAGYVVKSNGNLRREKIKINPVECPYGTGVDIYVRGVYEKTYGYWSSTNTRATKTDKWRDGEVITDNFEWKAKLLIGGNVSTVYFNY